MNSAITTSARRRAAAATAVFALSGFVGVLRADAHGALAAPLIGFYAVLVLNTYFSVRCFSSVAPASGAFQRAIDVTLISLYVLLSASFASPSEFALFAALLFAVSILKYVDLIQRGVPLGLLARKLSVNAVGCAACLVALAGMLAGQVTAASWVLAATNLAANVVLLWVWPLYRIEPGHS